MSPADCCEICGRLAASSGSIIKVARRADDINFVETRSILMLLCNLCRFKGKVLNISCVFLKLAVVFGFPLLLVAGLRWILGSQGTLSCVEIGAGVVAFLIGFPLAGGLHWLLIRWVFLRSRSDHFVRMMKLDSWGFTYNLIIE